MTRDQMRIMDLERQVDSLKEALRGAYDREPGPIGLEKALAREGYEIASESDGVVVIRQKVAE